MIFSFRRACAFIVLLAGSITASVGAATPAMGTLTDTSGPLTYMSGPFMVPNPTGAAALTCMSPVAPCDTYALTITLPTGFAASHPKAVFTVSTAWTNTTEDYDIYLNDSSGSQVNSSATSSDPEMYTQGISTDSITYSLVIVPYMPLGGTTTTTITLVPGAQATGGSTGSSSGPVLNQPQPAGMPPRFRVDNSPGPAANTSGEPSIGYNFNSRNGMFISDLQQLRLVFPWNQTNPYPDTDPKGTGANLPEACDANWVDVTDVTESLESLDPILHTDSKSGRTFVSQLTGANSLFAYSDDDGATWMQGQIGPPNGGPDHQTVGTGPYPAGSPYATIASAVGVNYATYYCSQAIAAAFCSRSDDGGLTFGNGNPIYITEKDCGQATGALHGHAKVGPDGAVYVAPKSCGSLQGVTVSTDAGVTWTVKTLPNTTADTEVDPSVAVGADYNTDGSTKAQRLYDCFISVDGHPHAQVSLDQGSTWSNDYDLGDIVGVVNATFPTAIAGDADRAACAFAGTTTAGNHDSAGFAGVWYNFISTTYDGGKTWFTVNLTPNDPVQGTGGLCNGGTLCGNNRNLLDFTETTLDEKGRILFGYADGCIGPCLQDPAGANSFADKGAVGRQTGGRGLLAKFDAVEPIAPNASCLAGDRTKARSHLTWNPPDTGGATVSQYTIYSSPNQAGPYKQVGMSGIKTTFNDTSDSVTDPLYYKITATNTKGEGIYSNIVKLPIGPDITPQTSCILPGITVFTDAAGDSTGGISQTDVLAFYGAEPPANAGKYNFTMNIASLNPLLPAVYYIILSKDTAGNLIYLQADTSVPTTMTFTYGTYMDASAGVLVFTQVGSLDAASTYDPNSGNIYYVADAAIFGSPAIGKSIPIDVRIRQGANSATSRDTGGPGAYTVMGTDICSALATPLADILADVTSGIAPLTVNFDASGSTTSNSGATVTMYTFDFGDGSAKVGPQASPKTSHTYTAAGSYKATVVVMDSVNQTSTNNASQFITVNAASGTTSSGTTTGTLPVDGGQTDPVGTSGAFGFATLLPLAALALRRRRRNR